MTKDDAVAYIGHRVHVLRRREVGTLMSWIGDVRGQRLLDVAGGDGYWAGQAARLGADSVSIDLARRKMDFGRKLRHAPALIEGDAQRLPFRDGSFDVVMSVCAIEHFDDAGSALDEMARVLRPGGRLAISADALTREDDYPELATAHRHRYHVTTTWPIERLRPELEARDLIVERHDHLFVSPRAQWLYFQLSRHRLAWNVAAPLSPLITALDRHDGDGGHEEGSVVLVSAVRGG